jgi:hypothetical protein
MRHLVSICEQVVFPLPLYHGQLSFASLWSCAKSPVIFTLAKSPNWATERHAFAILP